MYHPSENRISCQWDGCVSHASSHVFNSDLTESAYLCCFHRRVAEINLENYDRIRAPAKKNGGIPGLPYGPGSKVPRPPKPDLVASRPVSQWMKDAANAADAAAQPINPVEEDQKPPGRTIIKPIISDIPLPRKN